MAALFPFVLGAVGVVAAVFGGHYHKRMQEEAWSAAAAQLGLQFVASSNWMSYAEIRGDFRGVHVVVDVFARGSGDSKAHYTRYRMQYPSMVEGAFTLSKQRTLSFLGRFVGKTDHKIGDPTFDSRVVIDAIDPLVVDRFLSPARRMAVLQLMERSDFVEVTPRWLVVEYRGVEKKAETVVARITHLADIARVLSAPSDVDLALEQQERGDLADAVVSLHKLNDVPDGSPNSFTQYLEAEALVAVGDGEKASQILDDLPVFDPELGEWKTVAKGHLKPIDLNPIQPPPPRIPPAPSAPAPVAGSTTVASSSLGGEPNSVSLDQDAVIDDLFGSNRLSFDVEQRFFDVYELAHVVWTGTVQNSRNFRSDSDFSGAGVKATIVIGNRGESKLVSSQVRAIVHFAEGTSLANGSEVRFSGTLVRADRYMRNLFVAGAQLL